MNSDPDDSARANPQYSLATIAVLWLIVVIPTAFLSLGLAPWLIARIPYPPGLIYWGTIIAAMAWQAVVSLAVLVMERQVWTRDALRARLWLNAPKIPRTGKSRWQALWFIVPLGILAAFGLDQASAPLSTLLAQGLPHWATPDYGDITRLATPEFKGAWSMLCIALVSSVFNYALGEELFFHGILLPRMEGVFGRWAWIANGVLFGCYHVHKAALMPSIILSCCVYSFAAQRYRSNWPAMLIHGFEGIILIAMVLFVILGGAK